MANSTIPNLVAVSVPALTDLFGVRQSGDSRDKKLTVTQLLTLIPSAGDVSKVGTPVDNQIGVWTGDGTIEGDANFRWDGSHLLLPQNNDAAAPTLAFGDGDTGFYENSDDFLSVAIGGLRKFVFGATLFQGITPGAFAVANTVATATVPNLLPQGTSNTGIGGAAGTVSIIAGGDEIARAVEVVGANQLLLSPTILDNNPAAPTLAFGDGDTGLFESADDSLVISIGGTARWQFSGDNFIAIVGNGPRIVNEASTATNPTFLPALGDVSTGLGGVTGALDLIIGGVSGMHFRKAGAAIFIEAPDSVFEAKAGLPSGPTYSFKLDSNSGMYSGGAGTDSLLFSAGGVQALSMNELNSGVIQAHQANVAITAFATGGQASATQLDESYNVLSVVATTGDSVKLPPVFAIDSVMYIKNDGANAADVFPATGDDLGAGTNTAVSLAAGESASFIATVANATWTPWIVSVGGGGDVTKVGTPVNNQIGVWTGDGTLEGDANLIWDGSKLDITTGRIELPGGSAAAPPIGFQIDTGTGIYRVGNNNFGIASGGLASVSWLRQTGQIIQTNSLHTGLTASTTQTQGQGNLFSSYNVVSTVANANDVVTAMLAVAGKRLTIYNDGANILQVFPSTSDDIGAGVNSSITIAVGASRSWIANDGVTWLLIGSAP